MTLRTPTGRRLAGALLALALLLAACGGGGGSGSTGARTQPAPPGGSSSGSARQADVRVIRAWADTLRHGDVPGAARWFALPSIVSNGTTPARIRTLAQAQLFNEALPCGAVLIHTETAAHGFVIATFRLTERPGPGACGSGTGHTARTAFRIRDGHIVYWLRVRDVPSPPAPPAPPAPAPPAPSPQPPSSAGGTVAA